MSEQNLPDNGTVTTEVPPVPAPELPEQRYEYQPTDELGRPLGGKQVIVYRTPDELATKLSEQNTLLIRRLRQVTKEHRLGINPSESIPDDAERFDGVVEFKPRELSAEERFQISQELNDPEKFVDARDKLLESAVGLPPAKLTQVLNDQQLYIMQLRARDNYTDFVKANIPAGYQDSMDNREILTNWMLKNRLAPTVKNFNLAFNTLKEAGLLSDAPVVRQEPTPAPAAPAPVASEVPPIASASAASVDSVANPQPPAAAPSRIAGEPQPQAKRTGHVPSGLNDRVSSSNGVPSTPVGDGLSLTLAQIDALPADKLRPLMRNPEFTKHWEALLNKKGAPSA